MEAQTNHTEEVSIMTTQESAELYRRLSEPLPYEGIKLKIQAYNKDKTKGLIVAYVDARTVQDRLNEVLGIFGWGVSYEEILMTDKRWAVKCKLSILREDGTVVVHSDVGEGTPNGNDADNMIKGAYSDAFKRAAVHIGIGRDLYSLDKLWRALEGEGNYKSIKNKDKVKAEMLRDHYPNETKSAPRRPEQGQDRGKPTEKPKTQSTAPESAPREESSAESQGENQGRDPSMVTKPQFETMKELLKQAFDGDWAQIVERYSGRDTWAGTLEAYENNTEAALYAIMTKAEAQKILGALRKYIEKMENAGENS